MSDKVSERLSAFADDELSRKEMEELVDTLSSDPEQRACWERYHTISSALHNETFDMQGVNLAERVRCSIEAEPVSIRPRPRRQRIELFKPVAGFALAASVAVVAVLSVGGFRDGQDVSGTQVAKTEAAAPVEVMPASAPSVPMNDGTQLVRTPAEPNVGTVRWSVDRPAVANRLNGYLIYHRGAVGPGVQGVMPYARMVSYDAGR